jgi:hypothetical protein
VEGGADSRAGGRQVGARLPQLLCLRLLSRKRPTRRRCAPAGRPGCA